MESIKIINKLLIKKTYMLGSKVLQAKTVAAVEGWEKLETLVAL